VDFHKHLSGSWGLEERLAVKDQPAMTVGIFARIAEPEGQLDWQTLAPQEPKQRHTPRDATSAHHRMGDHLCQRDELGNPCGRERRHASASDRPHQPPTEDRQRRTHQQRGERRERTDGGEHPYLRRAVQLRERTQAGSGP
jgi:hypothetical protein